MVTGILLLVAACAPKTGTYEETRSLMGTYVTITVVSPNRARAEAAMDAAYAELDRLEGMLSIWREDTEVSLINRSAHQMPVRVSEETARLTEISLDVAEKTGGAFDPTIGPLVSLWQVTRRSQPPAEAEVARAREKVDYRNVTLGEDGIRINAEETTLDFGGIAKGYAADRAAATLRDHGIEAGIVSVAGDIRVFGGEVRGRPWNVGIQNPRGSGLVARLALEEGCISTSGDYERYFEYDGRRYHHIIDPRTGYPAEGARSVSIIGEESVYCDGFATGFFVLGPEEALRRMNEMEVAGLIVTSTGKIRLSDALQSNHRLELVPASR